MSSLNLLRGGFKAFNTLCRPHSSFMGRAANLSKKNSILFTSNQSQTQRLALVDGNQLSQFGQISRSVYMGPAARDEKITTHWNIEHSLSAALLLIIPASLMLETSVTDYLLAASLMLHSHWGCRNILLDYIHGPTLPKIAHGLLYVVSTLAFLGLCYFNYTDIGLAKAVKKIWSL